MKTEDCQSLEELRRYIDQLDDQIVELIATRNAYVKQAAKFKQSIDEIKGDERMEAVMDRVRNRAMEFGVSPNLLTKLYKIMIDEMVEAEIAEFRNAKSL
ncbi:MAG: chorismate mutase [Sulfuricurvum sp.]|uniref:chorismate mutase n=1 Tax=Sulfuricurvum sp. TaxID=2025608 RepID=UPI0026042545|nr:chorismate mutase [Sulfuricurvum sp.]MDD2829272.1 chorismate mutase [Sulfuricurvum sp.]MDD4949964.1 chorismate mutase [Sulfuricurvum sp.]